MDIIDNVKAKNEHKQYEDLKAMDAVCGVKTAIYVQIDEVLKS